MIIDPMLAKASRPFDSPDWLFEIKWDGERMIAFVEKERIARLQNRHGRDVTTVYPEIVGSHVAANEAILDGEMIVFGEDRKPSFSKLAQRSHLENGLKIDLLSKLSPAVYIPFDVIQYNGIMIDRMPLIKRKDVLDSIVRKESSSLSPSFFVEGNGTLFFEAVVNMGYEGIMAKKKDGLYLLGRRSDLWLKMKPRKSAICYIVGFTRGNGHRERLGALVIEEKIGETFKDRGHVGSGIGSQELSELIGSLNPLCESKDGKTVFVEPTTRIEVSYFEETDAGHYRFPVFKRVVE